MHAVTTAADACIAVALAGSLFFNTSLDVARPRLALYLALTLAPVALMTPLIGPAVARYGAGSLLLGRIARARVGLRADARPARELGPPVPRCRWPCWCSAGPTRS